MSRKFSGLILVLALLSPVIVGCGEVIQPVEITSVTEIARPRPTIEIVLKNIGDEPIIELAATFKLDDITEFKFDASNVNPLLPGESSSDKRSHVGPGSWYKSGKTYSLKINGTLMSGKKFSFTKRVGIGSLFEF